MNEINKQIIWSFNKFELLLRNNCEVMEADSVTYKSVQVFYIGLLTFKSSANKMCIYK